MKYILLLFWCLVCSEAFASSITLTGAGGSTPAIAPTGMVTPIIADNSGTAPSNSAVQYMGIYGGGLSATAAARDTPILDHRTFKNLTVSFPVALLQGQWIVKVAKNGVATTNFDGTAQTGCVITTTNTHCELTEETVAFDLGDRASYQFTPSGTPTAQGQIQVSMISTSYAATGMIVTPFVAVHSTTAQNFHPLGTYLLGAPWQTTDAQASSVIPTPGQLQGFCVYTGIAAGVGNSDQYTLWLNGIAQTSARVTMGAADLGQCITGLSIAVVASDLVSTESLPTGTLPAFFATRITYLWAPTTTGEAVQMTAAGVFSGGATRQTSFGGPTVPTATETTTGIPLVIAPSAFTNKLLRVTTTTALTGVNTRTNTFRTGVGAGQSNTALTCQLASGTLSGLACNDGTHSYTTAQKDLLDFQSVASGVAQATTTFKYSSVLYTP